MTVSHKASIVHIVITHDFAGTERYVCDVAARQAAHGHDVVVIGGDPARMVHELGPHVHHMIGGTPRDAITSLARLGQRDVVHAHMTLAEAAALLTRPRHRGRIVATRHFAQHRGSSLLGRAVTPMLRWSGALQIAISDFVAHRLERRPDLVLHNGVANDDRVNTADGADEAPKRVLLAQRLSPEKDSRTALKAWGLAGLGTRGWTLEIAGEGVERPALEALAIELGIAESTRFIGFDQQIRSRMRNAAAFIATAPAEPLGLAVLEAMSCGLPVLAAGSGGHCETVGSAAQPMLFRPGHAQELANLLSTLETSPNSVAAYGLRLREVQRTRFNIDRHVSRLLVIYTT